jgi:redox-sensitive bicupin YhaK (pirin superfamily)
MRRIVSDIVGGSVAIDGAGVKLVRVFGHSQIPQFDPFLLLDAFDSTHKEDYIKGFPWHPHRGIQTVTYLIKGIIEHGDSLGNKGEIVDGSCQWMIAGSGIIHQEMPKEAQHLLGAQLWINLPKKDKMCPPSYNDITSSMIKEVNADGALVRVLSGNYRGHTGPFNNELVPTLYFDVILSRNQKWKLKVDPEHTVVIYIISGKGYFDDNNKEIGSHRAVKLISGDTVEVQSGDEGLRFLFMSAKPLNEPIAWGGPIVMNTREELHVAFEELDQGTFIK